MRYKHYFFRKILLLPGCLGILNMIAQLPYNPISYTSPNSYSGNYSTGTHVFYGNQAQVQNLNVSGSANYTLKASKSIVFTPANSVSNLSSGAFHSYIDATNVLDIASFHTNGWNNIPKYDRFEIGVNLPFNPSTYMETSGPEVNLIGHQVFRFLTNTAPTLSKLNPYDPDQLKIKCTFVSSTNETYVRYGFHYDPYTVLTNSSGKLYWQMQSFNWTTKFSQYPFRIRFAPPETGTYKCKIEVYVNNVLQSNYIEFQFNAVTNTANPIAEKGHLKMSTDNSMKLKYENDDPFFGIGQNIPSALFDNYAPNFPYPYPNSMSSPKTHNEHRDYIQNLADNNGNFIRLRLDIWSVPIETKFKIDSISFIYMPSLPILTLEECVTNYYHNQKFMGEMDKTLALCEEEGVKLMFNLIGDGEFSGPNADGIDSWKDNPYSAYMGEDLSAQGFTLGVSKFFDSENNFEARKVFKKRLFYIMARWGYSPSIALWQMINETETTGGTGSYGSELDYTKLFDHSSEFRADLVDWICEMGSYLKGEDPTSTDIMYPKHLFTTGTIRWDNDSLSINHFLECMDVKSANQYVAFSSGGKFANDNDGRHNYGVKKFNESTPWIYGELGMPPQSFMHIIDSKNDRQFHNTAWTTAMSGNIANGMYWWDSDEKYGVNHRANFKSMGYFFSQVDLTKILKPKRKRIEIGQPLSTIDNSESNSSQTKKIFNYYMATDNRDYMIGWSMLGSSYWANDDPSSFYESTANLYCWEDPIECINQTSTSNHSFLIDKTELTNWSTADDYDADENELDVVIYNAVANYTYNVTLYKTYGNGGAITTFTKAALSNGQLKFSRKMLNHDNSANGTYYPDFAYIITQINPSPGQRLALENKSYDADVISNQNIRVFPNPASNIINIAYDSEVFKETRIQVLNETGQIVYSGSNEKKIETKDLASGFYILKFISGDFIKTFKISIVH